MELTDIIILLIVILFILLIVYIAIVNKLRKAVIKIEEANADIDVALAKRYDLITKMVEVVKGYSKYEKEVLLEVINLRKDMSIREKTEANTKISNGLDKVNMVVENYPELKANENFKVLQKSILNVEEHLQASRRVYNSNVSFYNQLIAIFPTNIIAKMNEMQPKEYFEIDNEKRENVKIEL